LLMMMMMMVLMMMMLMMLMMMMMMMCTLFVLAVHNPGLRACLPAHDDAGTTRPCCWRSPTGTCWGPAARSWRCRSW
jgi:hypothetical protein